MEDMGKSEKLAVFRAQFSSLPSLIALGFADAGTKAVPATTLLPAADEIRLSNGRGRALTLTFFANDAQEIVSVKIINTADDDSFGLTEWLKHQASLDSYTAFWLATYAGTFPERVTGFLRYLACVLGSADLAQTLAGGAWPEIPFDWAGMR